MRRWATEEPVRRRALFGALGGVLVFLCLEPARLMADGRLGAPQGVLGAYAGPLAPGVAVGGLITALLVFSELWGVATPGALWSKTIGSGLFGAAMGYGYAILAHALYFLLEGSAMAPDPITRALVARSVGWSIFGLGLGLGAGLTTQSGRRAYPGLGGGIVGGALAGVLFQMMVWSGLPIALRLLLGFALLGAAVGAATALVERMLRSFWVVYLTGSREGREVTLYRDPSLLGRNELADLPLFGDPDVPVDAARLYLTPAPALMASDGAHVTVDGAWIRQVPLSNGAVIAIGKHRLRFCCREDATRQPTYRPPSAEYLDRLLTPALEQMPEVVLDRPIGGEIPETVFGDAGDYFERVSRGTPHGGLALRRVGRPEVWLPLGREVLEIGREAQCGLALDDPGVSRLHARIEWDERGWILTDAGSTNGSFVNGVRIRRAPLAPGDRLRFGGVEILVEGDAQGVSHPASSPAGTLQSS